MVPSLGRPAVWAVRLLIQFDRPTGDNGGWRQVRNLATLQLECPASRVRTDSLSVIQGPIPGYKGISCPFVLRAISSCPRRRQAHHRDLSRAPCKDTCHQHLDSLSGEAQLYGRLPKGTCHRMRKPLCKRKLYPQQRVRGEPAFHHLLEARDLGAQFELHLSGTSLAKPTADEGAECKWRAQNAGSQHCVLSSKYQFHAPSTCLFWVWQTGEIFVMRFTIHCKRLA